MQLIETPLAPIPQGASVFQLETEDGVTLRVARFPFHGDRERGTLVLLQGRTEFIEKYFEVIDELRSRGLSVVAFDWRGHGLSDRQTAVQSKGHISHFGAYDRDLEAVMRNTVLASCHPPFFGLAHSMGGAIMLRALARGHEWFDRVVLNAPMVALHPRFAPGPMRIVAELVAGLGFGSVALPKPSQTPEFLLGFEGNNFTHDPARFARIAEQTAADPRLGIAAPTFGWGRAAGRAMAHFTARGFADHIHTPVMLIGAGADRIVSTPAIEALGARLKTGRTVIIDGARHEIMMENDFYRHQFWAAFDSFIPGDRNGL